MFQQTVSTFASTSVPKSFLFISPKSLNYVILLLDPQVNYNTLCFANLDLRVAVFFLYSVVAVLSVVTSVLSNPQPDHPPFTIIYDYEQPRLSMPQFPNVYCLNILVNVYGCSNGSLFYLKVKTSGIFIIQRIKNTNDRVFIDYKYNIFPSPS